jgi:hypothetical protein
MNLLSLVGPWLDNICQIRRKWYYLSDWNFLQSKRGLYICHCQVLWNPQRATAKLNITKSATDKLFAPISDSKSIILSIHDDKVQRICTFCAGFFHNADECQDRNTKVMSSSSYADQIGCCWSGTTITLVEQTQVHIGWPSTRPSSDCKVQMARGGWIAYLKSTSFTKQPR